jgi:hypothetical protein
MRSVTVSVFDSGGRPVQGARVVLWVYQFLASGALPEKYTNARGEAWFDLDVDAGAELGVSVNGGGQIDRGSIQGQYRIYI